MKYISTRRMSRGDCGDGMTFSCGGCEEFSTDIVHRTDEYFEYGLNYWDYSSVI